MTLKKSSVLCAAVLCAAVSVCCTTSLASAQSTYTLARNDKICKDVAVKNPKDQKDDLVKKESAANIESVAKVVASCLDDLNNRTSAIATALKAIGSKDFTHLELNYLVHDDSVRGFKLSKADLNRTLIDEHADYRNLKTWADDLYDMKQAEQTTRTLLSSSLLRANTSVHNAMAMRGLNEMFSAVIRSGAVVGNPARTVPGPSSASVQSSDISDKKTADLAAQIAWESKHFDGDTHNRLSLSLSGKLGLVPALTLIKKESSTNPTELNAEGIYREAFAWDISPRINVVARNTGTPWQVSAIGRIGQVILNTESQLIENGTQSTLVIPVGNGAGKAEMFFEGGLEFRLFNKPIDYVQAEGSVNSSAFTAILVFRKDNRFKKVGDLADFDAPERRGVAGFMLDALRVLDLRDDAEKNRAFTISFGVEHEWAWQRNGVGPSVPSGTKLVFRGDVDLLRAIQGRQ
ncbi:MAG: hypothetical protein ACO1Q7_16235 [Gemmatimonas sp.]